jgi:prepilin-type N-terminal cleavage/methylation domain-containing protein
MARARIGSQRGFTLVEVMVAISVLMIGVLGTVTMVDGANSLTSRNKSRQGATALGRSVLEIARSVPYRQLTASSLLVELGTRPGFMDAKPGIAGHQISSEGFTYTIAPTVCSMDDPADNLGAHTEVGVVFCTDSDSTVTPKDRNADDYRRVSVQLTWINGAQRTETTTQRAVVSNPVGGLGPSVTSLEPESPDTETIVTGDTTLPSYDVTTSTVADSVSWTVNGANRSNADGTDLSWDFEWDLGPVNAPKVFDCTYVLQAEAFDDTGRAGAPKALTVVVNRRQAFPPPAFLAGRNLQDDLVDIRWGRNRECDVKGYRVYRGQAEGSITELVCTVEAGEPTQCIDDPSPGGSPPATFPLYYQVVAIDSNATGGDREGDRSAAFVVEAGNAHAPDAPSAIMVCSGGNPGCVDSNGEVAPVGTAVLSWSPSTDSDGDEIAFYRIYRDGQTYAHRHDILFPVVDKPLVFVDSSVTGSHTYSVSAVDEHLGESELSGVVTWE